MKTLRLLAATLALGATLHAGSAFDAFADPELATLIDRALAQNQDLAAAAARVDQSRAIAGAARADFFPQVAIDASAARQRNLDNNYRASDYARLPGVATWELDLWGRVRKSTKAARAEAGAAQATFEAARVSLSAEVAQTHYTLRATELERATVERGVTTRRDARRIIADRAEIGTSSPLDLARADTELATAEAEFAAVSQRAANLRHAFAVLLGSESDLTLNSSLQLPAAPVLPDQIPSDLLIRRPDIAAAQRTLDAASARIGVARAAFFPTIALTGSAGWESSDFSDLLSGDTRVWSFGPKLYLPLFQGGRNRANLTRAEAAFAEQSARYRQSVLVAFRDVRDALAATRFLAEQTSATERAATASRRASDLSRIRYDAGAVSYLEVVESERSALDAERALARLRGQRLVAASSLIRALGGGWENASPAATAPLLARN